MLLDRGPPHARRGKLDVRPLASCIPLVDPACKALERRAVVAKGMEALRHDDRQRVVDLLQTLHNARPPIRLEVLAAAPDAIAPAGVIGPAVIGHDRLAAGSLPVEDVRAVERRAAEVRVDRHRKALDAEVVQQVNQGPVLAVDVAVHGGGDGHAVVVAQSAQQLEAFDQLVAVEQGREVGKHARNLDAARLFQGQKAVDLAWRGVLEPAAEHIGVLNCPAEGACAVARSIAVSQFQRRGNKAFMQIQHNWLVMGVAHVRMAVVNKVQRVDLRHCANLSDCPDSF